MLDIDAILLSAHSDMEGAPPTYKRGFGLHPILCCLAGEPLAGLLRPDNAGANTPADLQAAPSRLGTLPAPG